MGFYSRVFPPENIFFILTSFLIFSYANKSMITLFDTLELGYTYDLTVFIGLGNKSFLIVALGISKTIVLSGDNG